MVGAVRFPTLYPLASEGGAAVEDHAESYPTEQWVLTSARVNRGFLGFFLECHICASCQAHLLSKTRLPQPGPRDPSTSSCLLMRPARNSLLLPEGP